jgi:hypothetical protein
MTKFGLASKTPGDLAFGALGVLLATSAVGIASFMIAHSDEGPRVNSTEHLAIFAKPVSIPYSGGDMRRFEYDMAPTGAIRPRPSAPDAAPEPAAEIVANGYRMRGYSQGQALVQGPSGFVSVSAGGEIEGLGRVLSIEPRGRSLIIRTTGGVILSDD